MTWEYARGPGIRENGRELESRRLGRVAQITTISFSSVVFMPSFGELILR